MNWGGFFATRYANAYPQNVCTIYLDAPLLNFEILGKDPGRIGVWSRKMPADGDWSKDLRMPVNMAESLAKTGIPILLLYGG